jgi:hypothetical protein
MIGSNSMRRAVFSLAAVAILAGCRVCGTTPSEPPIHFVAKDAEAILEVRDVRVLVRLSQALARDFGAFITPAQVDSLRQELALTLGFDPTSDEGLKAAGIRKEGMIAAQIEEGGRSVLWVLPVEDAAKLGKTVKEAAAARIGASKTASEGEITVLSSEFGPELVTVAAFAVKGGTGLIGAGPKAKELVAGALARKPEESAASHPEYGKQVGALDRDWDLRMISPSGAKAVTNAVELVLRRDAFPLPDLSSLKSAGWALDGKKTGLEVQGNLRLDEAGMERARKLFATPSALPAGIRSLDVPGSALLLQTAGDIRMLIEVLAPAGSSSRARLDQFFQRVKQDVGTDVEAEVLPLLSGHGGVAFGAGDLSRLSLRELQRNPMSALWTAFAVGVKDQQTIETIERRLDPGLRERNIEVSVRNAAGQEVRSLTQSHSTLVETFGKGGAMVFSNEPAITNLIVANGGGRDLLNGKGGLALELRFGVLAKQLTTFPIASMPALIRGMARKMIEAVGLLDVLTVAVKLDPEGIAVQSELKLAIAPK